MKRVIVIGNGFDIAMGCNSSVVDFLLWIYKRELTSIRAHDQKTTKLFLLKNGQFPQFTLGFDNFIANCVDLQQMRERVEDRILQLNDKLLRGILDSGRVKGWYDIEQTYFDQLLELTKYPKTIDEQKITSLNESLSRITFLLNDFLIEQSDKISSNRIAPLKQTFESLNGRRELGLMMNKHLEQVIFINFNYTDILQKMVDSSRNLTSATIFHIHGSLNRGDSPQNIIVGFGDDQSEAFKQLESLQRHDVMKYIKTFNYSRDSIVVDILNICDADEYSLYIIGHSCSDTDRTIMKSLINHKNCLKIRLYHKGNQEDFLKRNVAVSRFIEDKEIRLKKILQYDPSDTFSLSN